MERKDRMQPLSTNRQMLAWFCIIELPNTTRSIRILHILFTLIVFLSNLFHVLASTYFVWKFASTDFEGVLYALYQVLGWLPIVYMMIIAFFIRHKIAARIADLLGIYDKCKWILILQIANNFQLTVLC